ncbi:MAG: M20/M25/M40 family metallo-hydrolase, partial [Planctomycetota bacterium]
GANDNKGQFWAHICAIRALLDGATALPVNLKVFVEGEEEIGSPGLEDVLVEHKDLLAADYCLVSDSEFYDEKTPAITYRLRGIAAWQVKLKGPADDLHSGIHGGPVRNPLNALSALVAAMHGPNGRVMLPGFYDDVVELTDQERHRWAELPFSEADYAAELGLSVEQLSGGENGFSVLQRRWGRPTLDVNGIVGGYIQEGIKTVLPAEATVKFSTRLVPDQDPEKISRAVEQFVAAHTPPGCRAQVRAFGAGRPVCFSPDSPGMQAGIRALREAFGAEPALIGCGASVPVTELFQRVLGQDVVMLGYGLPSDRIHSPNERFQLSQLFGGAVATACFLDQIGR